MLKIDRNDTLAKNVHKAIKGVLDPEIGIPIVDLGLIYEIKSQGKNVNIVMTLTSIGCPLWKQMEQELIACASVVEGIGKITVELTFSPPWSKEMMSQTARDILGFN